MTEQRYHAFISYSHADRRRADWLFRRIENFRVPDHLVGRIHHGRITPSRLSPLFKDREELASASNLDDTVKDALNRSDALIVICSPSAKESHWVNTEIREFKRRNGNDRVFPVIVEGDEHTSFPPALRQYFDGNGKVIEEDIEPLAADLIKDGNANSLLKIIAGLLNVSFDELKRRQLQRQMRRLTALSAASLFLVVFVTSLYFRALQAEREAAFRQSQAEGLVEFMISDLRGRLEPLGKLDLLDEVGNQAMDYFVTVNEDEESAMSKSRRGKVIQQLGEIELAQGRLDAASTRFREALAIQQNSFALDPNNEIRFQLSQASFWAGYALWEAGEIPEALVHMIDYREHSDALAASDPGNIDWRLETVYARINLGTVYYEQQEFVLALTDFTVASAELAALIEQHPEDPRLPSTLVQALGWIAGSYWQLGDWLAARDAFKRQAEVTRELMEANGDDFYAREDFVLALQRYGRSLARTGNIPLGQQRLEQAISLVDSLLEREANMFYWQYAQARGHWYLGELLDIDNQMDKARSHYELAVEGFAAVASDDRRVKFALEYAELLNDLAVLEIRHGELDTARARLKTSRAALEERDASAASDLTMAETLLAVACSSDTNNASVIEDARRLIDAHPEIRRPDHVALRHLVHRASGLAGADDSPENIDAFEQQKYAGCVDAIRI